MAFAEGRIIGNYALQGPLGRGATSEVYLAEHRFLGERAAIKVLRAELSLDDAAADAFLAEATKTRAVQHPNVVRVLDCGRDDATRRCYLVLELCRGESLAAYLARRGRLEETDVRRLGAAIAAGLAAVHAVGLVHRDLKPSNVMLDAGEPKLVDFGIARQLGGDAARVTSTRVGTPAYMAPEQLTSGLVAASVDVWALGVVLFELVTGRLPFEGFAEGRCPQLTERAPRASQFTTVSPELDDLLARCLEREPGRRASSMAQLAELLRGAADAADAADVAPERVTQDVGPLAHDVAPERVTQDVGPLMADARPTEAVGATVPAPRPLAAARRGRWTWAAALVGALAAVALVGAARRARAPGIAAEVPSPSLSLSPSPSPPPSLSPSPSLAPSPSLPPSPSPPAADTPRRLEVRSVPSGATVYVDGVAHGSTPLTLDVPLPATLVLRRSGYRDLRVRAAGSPIEVELQRRRARAASPASPRATSGETLD